MTAPKILLLPGWQNSDEVHWQSRWEALHGDHRVEQHDWMRPLRGDWSARLEEEVLASLNATEMARRRFREIARIAGLIFQSHPGEQRSSSELQDSS